MAKIITKQKVTITFNEKELRALDNIFSMFETGDYPIENLTPKERKDIEILLGQLRPFINYEL
jgi:hypothetical protein